MKKTILLLTTLAFAGLFSAPAFSSDLESVVSRARAAVAPERVLSSVETLTFDADVFSADGNKAYGIFLQFKRPYFMRELVSRTETIEPDKDFFYPEENAKPAEKIVYEIEIETICDGNEGVRIIRNLTTKERTVDVLPASEVIVRRAFTSANLDFYKILSATEGTTVFKGEQIDNGKKVNVVEYNYNDGLKIVRAFDAATGALFSTTVNNEKTYDVGEKMLTGGLIFLDGSRSVDANGNPKNTFKFKKILVNENLPDSLFHVSLSDLFLNE